MVSSSLAEHSSVMCSGKGGQAGVSPPYPPPRSGELELGEGRGRDQPQCGRGLAGGKVNCHTLPWALDVFRAQGCRFF